jgi:hypothetical protein
MQGEVRGHSFQAFVKDLTASGTRPAPVKVVPLAYPDQGYVPYQRKQYSFQSKGNM